MFIDANIFIYAYVSSDKRKMACKAILDKIALGEQHASTSPLAMDEVLYYVLERYGLEKAEGVWERMLRMPNLSILAIDSWVTSHVFSFVKAGLDPRDAFHAACMKANGISTICSYDAGFDKISSINRQEPK